MEKLIILTHTFVVRIEQMNTFKVLKNLVKYKTLILGLIFFWIHY